MCILVFFDGLFRFDLDGCLNGELKCGTEVHVNLKGGSEQGKFSFFGPFRGCFGGDF